MKQSALSFILVCMSSLILVACGGGTAGSFQAEEDQVPHFATHVLEDDQGAVLVVESGPIAGASVVIPPNAIARRTTIVIRETHQRAINPAALDGIGPAVLFSAKRPDGSDYGPFDNNRRVSIRVPFDRSTLSGLGGNLSNVVLFSIQEDGSRPVAHDFTIQPGTDLVQASVQEFGVFFLQLKRPGISPMSVLGFSPQIAKSHGGETLSISGLGIVNPLVIEIGGNAINASAPTATQGIATIPAHTVGPTTLVISSPLGSATLTGFLFHDYAFGTNPNEATLTLPDYNGGTPAVSAGPVQGASALIPAQTIAAQTTVHIAETTQRTINPNAFDPISAGVLFRATKSNGSHYGEFDNNKSVTIKVPFSAPLLASLNGTLNEAVLFSTREDGSHPIAHDFTKIAGDDFVSAEVREFGVFFLQLRRQNVDAMEVTSFTPQVADFNGNETIMFDGLGLVNPIVAKINGVALPTEAIRATSANTVTIAQPLGSATLELSSPLGDVTLNGFTFHDPSQGPNRPQVTSISPSHTPLDGKVFVIRGSNFTYPGIEVLIDGIKAEYVHVIDDHTLTGEFPLGTQAGPVELRVINNDGRAVLPDGVTYHDLATEGFRPDQPFDKTNYQDPWLFFQDMDGKYLLTETTTSTGVTDNKLCYLEFDAANSLIRLGDLAGTASETFPYNGEGYGNNNSFDLSIIGATRSIAINIRYATAKVSVTTYDTTTPPLGINHVYYNDTTTMLVRAQDAYFAPEAPFAFSLIAGTYQLDHGLHYGVSATIDISIDGSVHFVADLNPGFSPPTVIDYEWDGNSDYVGAFSFSGGTGVKGTIAPLWHDNAFVIEINTRDDPLGLLRIYVDARRINPIYRVDTNHSDWVRAGLPLPIQGTFANGLPDFFRDYAGTYESGVLADYSPLPHAQNLPFTPFLAGTAVAFTVQSNGSVTIGGHTLTWDGQDGDEWQYGGTLILNDGTTYYRLTADYTFMTAFQVTIKEIRVKDGPTSFSGVWLFDRPD